jgi:hypothetical protein
MFLILLSISDELCIAANMVTLKKQSSSLSYSNALLEELKSETFTRQYNVSKKVSGDENVLFSVIFCLLRIVVKTTFSSYLPVPNLHNLVTVLYTGRLISIIVSFPISRSNRQQSSKDTKEDMVGFHGRFQKEFNGHPDGRYMGTYDQNTIWN